MKEALRNIIKKSFRFVRYRNERKKFIREINIRQKQDQLLKNQYDGNGQKLILFLIPGSDWATGKDKISGGAMSIVSICEETASMKFIHQAQTIMCTMNGDHLFLKHSMFNNETDVFRFEQLASYFTRVTEILIHIPEFLTEYFIGSLHKKDLAWIGKMQSVHVNIMNQNIRLMPELQVITGIKQKFSKVTITTAHQKYCSQFYRNHFDVPIHKFSVWISPEQYEFCSWEDKENLLVISPDAHPMKEKILQMLENAEGLNTQIIQNLTYQEYKKLISKAKWTLTFGEGLDGYLIEPVFSGAIAFAVFNDEFFTSDFKELKTIYDSFETLQAQILPDIQRLDNREDFMQYQRKQFDICAVHYSKQVYRNNIAEFYKANYTFK